MKSIKMDKRIKEILIEMGYYCSHSQIHFAEYALNSIYSYQEFIQYHQKSKCTCGRNPDFETELFSTPDTVEKLQLLFVVYSRKFKDATIYWRELEDFKAEWYENIDNKEVFDMLIKTKMGTQ